MSPQTIKPRNMKEALMKEAYEILDMDVVAFDTDDVITTSCPEQFKPDKNETEMGG